MRSNRLLGANLVEANLVKIEDLEKANEQLLSLLESEEPRQCTLLGILVYQMKVLREDDALQYIVENEGVGLVDLRVYDLSDDVKKSVDVGACWATWSLPFDRDEDYHFIATAYYLSPAVRTYWEKQCDGPVLWFGTTLEGISEHLERIESDRAATAAAMAPDGAKPV